MSTHGPDPDNQYDDPSILDDQPDMFDANALPEPPHPINWNLLSTQELETELLELNRWVDWLRHTYGLPASVVPPYWHRHPELVWELSALHLHWLCADARHRLRDWVTASDTRLDRDRPTRQTTWPGEEPQPTHEESVITDRDSDFVQHVIDQVNERHAAEDAFYASLDERIDPATGEVRDNVSGREGG